MSRPTVLAIGNAQYWTITLYDSSGALIDADSNPTVAIRRNGASTSEVVTVTKRTATTGIYDCSFTPGTQNDSHTFCVEETATISGTAFFNSWPFSIVGKTPLNFDVVSVDTNNASIGADVYAIIGNDIPYDPSFTANIANRFGEFFDASSGGFRKVNNVLYTGSTISNVATVGTVTNAVTTDAASRTASQADVSGLASAASVAALNDFDPSSQTVTTDAASRTASQANVSTLATASELATVPKIGTQYTHTAQSGDTIQVTIS